MQETVPVAKFKPSAMVALAAYSENSESVALIKFAQPAVVESHLTSEAVLGSDLTSEAVLGSDLTLEAVLGSDLTLAAVDVAFAVAATVAFAKTA